MRHLVSLSLALILLVGCAPRQTPGQQAFLEELAGRPVTCKGEADCERKWDRAIEWVSLHTQRGLRTVGDRLISTNTISDGTRATAHYTEFSVVRYDEGRGARFEFKSYCDLGYPCNPTALQLRADFVTFVMGTPPGVAEVSPGVFQKDAAE